MKLKRSKSGLIVAAIFMTLALAALFSHLYSVKTNPGDSGESAIILLPFSIPWILMVPTSVAYSKFWAVCGYIFYIVFAGINAFVLYIFTGGMKWER